MALNYSSSSWNTTDILVASSLERRIKFFILITLQTPSFCCTLFILRHFSWRHLQTQIYGFLLIPNALILGAELSITLYYLYEGTIYFESRCSPWITLNYTLFQLSIFLMTWISIQRYLFIYHEQFIQRHMILLHYGPVIFLYVYCPLLYVGMVMIYGCKPTYDVTLYICGGPCYSLNVGLGIFDWIGNGISMEMTTFFVNVLVTIRLFIQRYRMKRAIATVDGHRQWRRSVKLGVQLIAIGMIYVVGWVPYSIIVLIQMFNGSGDLANILSNVFAYLPYFQELLVPYACVMYMPEVKAKLAALLKLPYIHRRQHPSNQIRPTTFLPSISKHPMCTVHDH
ncbi:unnamed protein product [Rotaria socialis]|uniref:G-protein coupled receptors family 1 profile domain-containing protein n=1 Tax=Rotaria socialis TaxID=392032 RepID=A0A820Y6Q4_9BILA|nr:unnamed protein product [Rotaria socialis]CAF4545305.1 unnamed protein product [Rotaria socialis]